jgi:hypothetical protein
VVPRGGTVLLVRPGELVATMAAAAGIGLDDLFASMVERAREG